MKIVADQRWYITDEGLRVPEGHPRARRLLVGKGCEISEEEFKKYPLSRSESEGKAIQEPPETKAIRAPKRR